DVSCDYVLLDDAPRRSLHVAEDTLGDRLSAVAELSEEDLASLRNVIDASWPRAASRPSPAGSADRSSGCVHRRGLQRVDRLPARRGRPSPAPARGRLGLATRLADIAELSAEDRSSLLHMLDAVVTKNRLKALAGERG
ncbi:MAG: hypothetical protein LC721_12140, partial [Actinobacteria bacterium]|nr:hypothetical protein [Actinomycetota bacterium]